MAIQLYPQPVDIEDNVFSGTSFQVAFVAPTPTVRRKVSARPAREVTTRLATVPSPEGMLAESYQVVRLLSRPEAAAYLGVKPQTLASWCCSHRVALPYVKLGRRVMYRRVDLERFVAENVKGAVLEMGRQ